MLHCRLRAQRRLEEKASRVLSREPPVRRARLTPPARVSLAGRASSASPEYSVLTTPFAIRSAVSSNGAREAPAPNLRACPRLPDTCSPPLPSVGGLAGETTRVDEWWTAPTSARTCHVPGCQRAKISNPSTRESMAAKFARRPVYLPPSVVFHQPGLA